MTRWARRQWRSRRVRPRHPLKRAKFNSGGTGGFRTRNALGLSRLLYQIGRLQTSAWTDSYAQRVFSALVYAKREKITVADLSACALRKPQKSATFSAFAALFGLSDRPPSTVNYVNPLAWRDVLTQFVRVEFGGDPIAGRSNGRLPEHSTFASARGR